MFMCLGSPAKIPHEGGKVHTQQGARTHTINQCRLMTVLMGKCTGFPQGHQGPEHFNWQDQILLPFPPSSSPSRVRDNAVCILIRHRVPHSAWQSLSRQLGGIDVREVGGHTGAECFFCFFAVFCKDIIDSGDCCFLRVNFYYWLQINWTFDNRWNFLFYVRTN